MYRYIFKIKPLRPYVFFGESMFGDDQQEYYWQESRLMPQQTTITGAIMELILRDKTVYNANFVYNDDVMNKIDKLIGGLENNQFNNNLGIIEKVSPVLIANSSGEYLMRNNLLINCENPITTKYELGEEAKTSVFYSKLMDIDNKSFPSGFLNMETKKIIDENEVYSTVEYNHVKLKYGEEVDGVRTNKYKKYNDGEEGSYYVLKKYMLKDQYHFQVEVELNEELELKKDQYFMTIGSKTSPFEVQIIKTENIIYDIQFEKIKKFLGKLQDEKLRLVKSPTIIDTQVDMFAIGEKTTLRHFNKYNNLGIHNDKSYFTSYDKMRTQKQVIMPGSLLAYDDTNSCEVLLKNGVKIIEKENKRSEDEVE